MKRKMDNNKFGKNLFLKIVFKLIIIFLITSFLLFLLFFINSIFLKNNQAAVIFFDVGQGDAILLRNINGKNILIDGGPNNLVLKKLGKFLPYFSRRLDLVILSHSHDDHLGGLIEVFHRYQIGCLLLAKNLESSYLQDLLLSLINDNNMKKSQQKKTEVIYIEQQKELSLNECNLIFLNPLVLKVPDNDNNSLITKLTCPGRQFFFAGDNETKVEQALLQSGFDLSVDVFKASHHGSKTSNTKDFLEALSPSFFIISVAENNRFGHPSPEVLGRVKDLGINIKRTDYAGDIVFLLD